jgi:hypothetical protein
MGMHVWSAAADRAKRDKDCMRAREQMDQTMHAHFVSTHAWSSRSTRPAPAGRGFPGLAWGIYIFDAYVHAWTINTLAQLVTPDVVARRQQELTGWIDIDSRGQAQKASARPSYDWWASKPGCKSILLGENAFAAQAPQQRFFCFIFFPALGSRIA